MSWFLALAILAAATAAVLLLPPLRRALLTGPIFAIYKRMLPAMSQTEREALEAGTVWWEGELFSGRPDWAKLHEHRSPPSKSKPHPKSKPSSKPVAKIPQRPSTFLTRSKGASLTRRQATVVGERDKKRRASLNRRS